MAAEVVYGGRRLIENLAYGVEPRKQGGEVGQRSNLNAWDQVAKILKSRELRG